jgi:hypothetical protein
VNGSSTSWEYAVSDVHAVHVNKTDRTKFTLSIIERFEFEADDASKVQQILDAFRALGMGQIPLASTNTGMDPSPARTDGHHRGQSAEFAAPTSVPAARLADFDIARVIGEGSFGQVVLATRKDSGKQVALCALSFL